MVEPIASDGIHVVDTHYIQPLFDAAHLVVQDGRAAFVDCGTAHAVPRLLAALEAQGLGIESVDWLLLTHVHLDHAGGAGHLLQALPRARVAVHPRGAPHLTDPRKLIDASIAVYGEADYRRLYGELLPIDASRVEATADGATLSLGRRRIEVLHTPGHALHHQAFLDHAAQVIFTGDTFGVAYGALAVDGHPFSVPTTSPTQFDPEQLLASIARVTASGAHTACLTHYGRIGELPRVGEDLARMVRRFTETALTHAARPAAELDEWRRLGATAPESLLDRWAGLDFDLNADGLMAWLARRAR